MPYIGRDLNRGNYLKLDDISSSFNGSTKTFNLTVGGSAFTPGSAFSILVSVGGVIQEPESAYQVNNSEITFANAPTAQDGFFCIALGVPLGIGVPGNGTVNGPQIAKPFNYDGFFYLNDASNRVGINSSIPTSALDVSGTIKASSFSGPIGNSSGISTFFDLRVTNNLTVEGTTTTLDTNLVGVDRVEVGANSNSIVGVAVTQSGTADLVRLFDGAKQVVTIDDEGKIGICTSNMTAHANADDLIVSSSTGSHAGITIRAGAGGETNIFFADSDSGLGSYQGIIQYVHTGDQFRFYTAGLPRVTIQNGGGVNLLSSQSSSSNLGWTVYGGDSTNSYSTLNTHFPTNSRMMLMAGHGTNECSFVVWNKGDANTAKGFGISNAGVFKYVHGASELVRFQPDGNVGIGTDNPVAKLDVRGSLNITGVTTVANDTYLTFGTNATANNNLRIRANSSGNRNEYRSTYQDFFATDLRIRNISTNNHYVYFWSNQISLFASGTERLQVNGSGATVFGNLELSSTYPSLTWTDTNHNSDYRITNNDGTLIVYDNTNSRHVLDFQPDGDIKLPVDNKKLMFGAGDDLKIYHSTFNYIESYNDSEIHINANTGGSVENMAKFKPNGAVELYHNGTKKVETFSQGLLTPNTLGICFGDGGCKVSGTAGSGSSAGIFFMTNSGGKWQITGDGHLLPSTAGAVDIGSATAEIGHIFVADNKNIHLGNAQDFVLKHDGTNSNITNATNDLNITNTGDDIVITANDDINLKTNAGDNAVNILGGAAVELYHNASKKFETTSTGATVTNELEVEGITVNDFESGRVRLTENAHGFLGGYIHYDGSANFMYMGIHPSNDTTVGNDVNAIKIHRDTNAKIELNYAGSKKLETATGGVQVTGALNVTTTMHIPDGSVGMQIGSSNDMIMYHNGSNSFIQHQGTGSLYIDTLNNSADIYIRSKDNLTLMTNNNSQSSVACVGNGGVILYNAGSQKFTTNGDGISVTGRADPAADSSYDLGTNATRWRTLYADTINVSANGNNTNGTVANFRGGVYNQINIAHANNSGWGLLLTNTDQATYGSNSGYHFSTNTSTNKPCAVVNVNSDALHFATANTSRFYLTHQGHFLPYANGSYDLGGGSNRVRDTYGRGLNLESSSAIVNDLDMIVLDGSSSGFNGGNDSNTQYGIQFKGCSFGTGGIGTVQRIGGQITFRKEGSWNNAAGGGSQCRTTIAFTSSTGTFDNGSLAQKDRLRITSTGEIQCVGADDNKGFAVYISDTQRVAELIEHSADGELRLYTGNATPQLKTVITSYGSSYITSAGTNHFGLGTSTPRARLDVRGTALIADDEGSVVPSTFPAPDVQLMVYTSTLGQPIDTNNCARLLIATDAKNVGAQGYHGAIDFGSADCSASGSSSEFNYRTAAIMCRGDGDTSASIADGDLQFYTKQASSGLTHRFDIAPNGDLTGTDQTIGNLSDQRLKTNIQDFTYDLNKFKQLKTKTFDWINPEFHREGNQRGFIAQEIETVDNYWNYQFEVSKETAKKDYDLLDNGDENYTIRDHRPAKASKLTGKDAMYVSVIQQLMSKIETLEAKVAALEGS